ncbi:RNA polymerase sigma factor [Tenacibaculum sp. M341]|uniref:RNA polymerase sigma factor n=1 Tax=Tenacibaculum sp. M341 TaxID=2530339 RepID=UPI00104A6D04|nr:sigma-70 family RNA polymerase sigma factor [Tenacibaculum sp. M341]TCI90203.1 sigma-70 family RNA polymerase sigma factor [Tenacibaculum sp. M341]
MDSEYFLQSIRKGDNIGIGKIYTKLYPKVKRHIIQRDGSEDDAKDIMQKALMQLSVRAQDTNFEISSSFDGYFMVICKNLWIREAKKLKLRVTNDTTLDLVSDDMDVAMSAFEQEKWELFKEKLQEISENCRELLQLFFKKVSYKQIASLKNYASENTVKQRIFKCKAKLKDTIQSDRRYADLKHF